MQEPGIWIFPFFLAGGLVVTNLFSYLAGYGDLLKRFPPQEDEVEDTYRFASGYLGWVHFGSALTVRFGRKGLHLAPMAMFRTLLGRGLPCIPWSELEQVRTCDTLVGSYFLAPKFRIRATGSRFSLSGRPGMKLQERLKTLPGSSGAIPPPPIHPM